MSKYDQGALIRILLKAALPGVRGDELVGPSTPPSQGSGGGGAGIHSRLKNSRKSRGGSPLLWEEGIGRGGGRSYSISGTNFPAWILYPPIFFCAPRRQLENYLSKGGGMQMSYCIYPVHTSKIYFIFFSKKNTLTSLICPRFMCEGIAPHNLAYSNKNFKRIQSTHSSHFFMMDFPIFTSNRFFAFIKILFQIKVGSL